MVCFAAPEPSVTLLETVSAKAPADEKAATDSTAAIAITILPSELFKATSFGESVQFNCGVEHKRGASRRGCQTGDRLEFLTKPQPDRPTSFSRPRNRTRDRRVVRVVQPWRGVDSRDA